MSMHRTAIRNGERVSISEVPSGKNENMLFCGGGCGENVVAKKGEKKEGKTRAHHFSHLANSNCSYYDKKKGGGGKGKNHEDAQKNFIQMYEDPNVKSIIFKYHPPCLNGSACKEIKQIDIKKEFPPSEHCIDMEYRHKTETRNCSLDLAIYRKRGEVNIPVFCVEIIDKHTTKESEREGLGCEWVSIRADDVNIFFQKNEKTLNDLKKAHCGDTDIRATFNCIRDKIIFSRCQTCHGNYEEYQKELKKREERQNEIIRQAREKAEQEQRETLRKLEQDKIKEAERQKIIREKQLRHEQQVIDDMLQYEREEAERQKIIKEQQLRHEQQMRDAMLQARLVEKDSKIKRMEDNIHGKNKIWLKQTIFDILKNPIVTRKKNKQLVLREIKRCVDLRPPHKKTYKVNKSVKCERCGKNGGSIHFHKEKKYKYVYDYNQEENDNSNIEYDFELNDTKLYKIYYCENCHECIEDWKRRGYGDKSYYY